MLFKFRYAFLQIQGLKNFLNLIFRKRLCFLIFAHRLTELVIFNQALTEQLVFFHFIGKVHLDLIEVVSSFQSVLDVVTREFLLPYNV